ncbi:hypothetical protein DFR79_103101 [Halanaerobium saccharolyticum]|uniref:Uncharacterized protein n=1 Tax=Halanaerobium saccharolyticum TaxID=43595 RepID=A0A4R6LZZ9_9FIRM|nr:hypothetical protein [Halanaerobium saccharolyticum]TDO94423.1 hypothetical protein DFR79_103101 [Halanaerobium saccharolyticum]
MVLNQKNLEFYYPGLFVINLCIYLFMSTVINYFLSFNTNLVNLLFILILFISTFFFSILKSELIIRILNLKNTIITAKFILAVITFIAALLIYNDYSFESAAFYLLIFSVALIYGILNSAYSSYYQKNKNEKLKEIIIQHNLEKLIIIILTIGTVNLIKITMIPITLTVTAAYYLLSGYINTFQKI